MTFALIMGKIGLDMLLSMLVAALAVVMAVPPIVRVSRMKDFLAYPNGITSHKGSIPYLGGIGLFAALVIGTSLFVSGGYSAEFQFIIAALLLMFFLGLKADINGLSRFYRLTGQVIASLIVIIGGDLRISTLYGILGIHQVDILTSILLSMSVFLILINAFKFIDGIDGLATGLGLQISLVLGFWLAFMGLHDYSVMAFALAGALAALCFYNVFGNENKLFLGGTGAMLTGLVFSIIIVRLLCCELPVNSKMYFPALPVLMLSLTIIPVADMLRVVFMRLVTRRPPFLADKTHVHHDLIRLNMSHIQASFLIVFVNICIFIFAYSLRNIDVVALGFIVLGMGIIATALPGIFVSGQRAVGSLQ